MKIDLLDPKSFEGGQPHDQFRWLRENDLGGWGGNSYRVEDKGGSVKNTGTLPDGTSWCNQTRGNGKVNETSRKTPKKHFTTSFVF